MSQSCATCNTPVSGEDFRVIPTASGGTLTDGIYCEAHWATALETVRSALATASTEDFEQMMQAALLRAYFGGRGIRTKKGNELDGLGITDVEKLLAGVAARGGFWWRQVMCSTCMETLRELDITTIPSWNDSAGDYVTSFRCATCAPKDLAETRDRMIAQGDVARVCAFFERHGTFIHEHRRGDPPSVVIPLVERLLAMLGDGSLVLPIGKSQPIGP